MLFKYEGSIATYDVGQVHSQIVYEYQGWHINVVSNRDKVFYSFDKNILLARQDISSKLYNYLKYINKKNVAVIKLQFKFVKNFEIVETEKTHYWKGTMSNAYLECVVFLFKRLPNKKRSALN